MSQCLKGVSRLKTIKHFIGAHPKTTLIILALGYLALNTLYPLLNKPLANTFFLGTVLDQRIPFSPQWIIPYVLWYLYLLCVPLLIMVRNQQKCAQALLSMILGLAGSFLIFSLFQTHVPRPEIVDSDFFSAAVRLIYRIDEPYNAFPSIHVLASFILMLATAKTREFSWHEKTSIWMVGTAIILSTVFIKQHVVADIVGGVALAFVSFRLAVAVPIWKYLPVQGKQSAPEITP